MPIVDLGKIIPTINGKDPVNGTLSLNTNDIPYDETDTAKSKIDKMDAATAAHLADLAYDIKNPPHPMVAAKGNANYFNSSDGKWYEDEELTILATNDGPAINAIINAAKLNGRNVKITQGSYWLDNTEMLIDNSTSVYYMDKNKISIFGDGIQNSRINYTGNGKALSIIGGKTGTSNAMQSFQDIHGFTLFGDHTEGSIGLNIEACQGLDTSKLNIVNFDYGVYGIDIDNASFYHCIIHWNRRGVRMQEKNPRDPNASTRPNNINFYNCHLGGDEYGAAFFGMTNVNFYGGSVQGNGINGVEATRYGIGFFDAGVQGGVGCNINGVMFESNTNLADIWIANQTPIAGIPLPTVYNITGCTFNRTQNTYISDYNILCAFNSANFGQQKLVCTGNNFRNFTGQYTPSAARPHVHFGLDARSKDNCYFYNNIQSDDTEKVLEDVPMPIATSTVGAVGEFKQIAGGSGTALSLPAGGTWEWSGFWVNVVSLAVNYYGFPNAGISSGGTEIMAAHEGYTAVATIRRIA